MEEKEGKDLNELFDFIHYLEKHISTYVYR